MLGGNGFSEFFKSNAGKIILGVLGLILAAGGITGPMVAMDNTNEAQQAELDALIAWQTEFYGTEWPAHLKAYGEFVAAVDDFRDAYVAYTELTDQALADMNKAIEAIDAWLTEFYNNDPDALGEWQEAMAVWEAFYNTDFDPHTGYSKGEFQETIEKLWKAIAALQSQPPTIIYITETE